MLGYAIGESKTWGVKRRFVQRIKSAWSKSKAHPKPTSVLNSTTLLTQSVVGGIFNNGEDGNTKNIEPCADILKVILEPPSVAPKKK